MFSSVGANPADAPRVTSRSMVHERRQRMAAPRVLLALLAVRAARLRLVLRGRAGRVRRRPAGAPGRAGAAAEELLAGREGRNTAGCSSCSTSARASTIGATASPRCSGRPTTPNPRRCGCWSARAPIPTWATTLGSLHCASVFDPDDCHECAQILVDAKADLTYRKDGLTPLEYAKYREGRPRVVKVLEDASRPPVVAAVTAMARPTGDPAALTL